MELHIYVYSYINICKDSIEFEQMTATPKVKIYHNPECGTSRNTLALIRNANIEPDSNDRGCRFNGARGDS
jgi:arsenate reductase